MALASLSPETKIKNALRELNCAESNFAKLVVGIVGKTRIAEALNEEPKIQRDFNRGDSERLLEFIQRMRELQNEIDAPLDWSRTDKIGTALATRLANKIGLEEFGDDRLNAAAAQATQSVK